MRKGKLIVIDASNDRIGKSTFTDKFIKALEARGETVVTRHFNNAGSITGQYINYLLNPNSPTDIKRLPWLTVAELYIIDFKDSQKWIEEQLAQGKYVVLDRYYTSTLLYEATIATLKDDLDAPEIKEKVLDCVRYIKSRVDVYKLVPIDATILLYANCIIEQLYDNVKVQADNLEGLDFQNRLIKVFSILKDYASEVFENPQFYNRLDEKGQLVEADEIVATALKEV